MEKERIETLKDMLESAPEDSFLRFAIAKEYEKKDDPENAEVYYQHIRNGDPEYIGVYYHLAKLYEYQERLDEAMTIYEEGIAKAMEQKDFHALSELNNAKMNLEMEL